VRKARESLEEETRDLKARPRSDFEWGLVEDDGAPFDVFTEYRGRFWGMVETRDFMRAKYGYLKALEQCRTRDGLQMVLDHALECLRLCSSDNLGVRFLVPSLLLILHKTQEAYDFVKWWETCDTDGRNQFRDAYLPYVTLQGENMLEDSMPFTEDKEVSNILAYAMVKHRLLLGVSRYEEMLALLSGTTVRTAETSPPHVARLGKDVDVLKRIRGFLDDSDDAVKRTLREAFRQRTVKAVREDLIRQRSELVNKAFSLNKFLRTGFLEPPWKLEDPHHYSRGDANHAIITLKTWYPTFSEAEGAIRFIIDAGMCYKDSSDKDADDADVVSMDS